ncbi:MAG: glyceraldehyde-3-phosphate dehydrogenase 1 [Icmadophila ericetorum]|nr:glyceraldehyde-3-phosphate dehydrogenase 1 [Icmadophila ericetorum]
MEKNDDYSVDFSSSHGFMTGVDVKWGENGRKARPGVWRRVIDGFKRDPTLRVTGRGVLGADGKVFDADEAARNTANSPLSRKLKGRHLQMIAIGGSIGTGLFVSSGKALADGGPASLFIAFSLIGIMLYCTVQALGEMAVAFPVAGSFSAYSTRFLDPAWGFAMGWNYALQWLVVLPLEIVSASITIDFWGSSISNAIYVAIFLGTIVTINMFGVKGYGEAEFVFAIVKVVAIVGFIILGIILDIGGGPEGTYIGGKYWYNPGAFNHGFKGLCSVFVTAAFAFGGTELVGLAAAETANPRRSLPTAVKQVFWRICLFYIISLLLVGLLVPYDNPHLINGTASADARASPFVIAITNASIQVLDSVMNVVIMISVLSVGNSSIYGSSRTIAALAEQNQAPKIFAYIDREGRPLVAVLFASSLGFLAFLAASSKQEIVFTWLLAISGLSSILTWGSICLAHIRFRAAWHFQGHALSELSYTSQAGVIGSWIGLGFNILILIAQFWTGFAPVGYAKNTPAQNTMNFFEAYLTVPIVAIMYLAYKWWHKTPFMRVGDMDLHTGMRELDLAELLAEERAEKAKWPRWKRAYKVFC